MIKRRYLCCRYHTDPVPVLHKPLVEEALRILDCRLAQVAGVHQRNERVGAMFEHIILEALGETLCCRVELVEHCVAPPPLHQADGVWFHPRHEEIHAPSCTEVACADVRLVETDRWAC